MTARRAAAMLILPARRSALVTALRRAARTAGVVYGLHEEMPVAALCKLGVGAAAASVTGAGTSDAVLPMEQCLALGERHGHRATSEEQGEGGRAP